MFGLGKAKVPTQPLACYLSDYGYSLVGLKDAQRIHFCENHYFTESSPQLMANHLNEDIEKYHLYGQHCQVILAPTLYQLVLMDALEVAEEEMAKALRWQLKGLIDYPLNDIAVDAFIVPPHGGGKKRKKVFVAVTLQSALINKIAFLENSLLNVTGISISELAIGNLLNQGTVSTESPIIVISYDDELCHLYLFYQGDLYLFRGLSMSKSIMSPNSSANQDMLLEIQRSIDYCLMELKLPEPNHIIFTPSFYEAKDLFTYLQGELDKDVHLLDVNSYFISDPLLPENMAHAFYAIGGAMMHLNGR